MELQEAEILRAGLRILEQSLRLCRRGCQASRLMRDQGLQKMKLRQVTVATQHTSSCVALSSPASPVRPEQPRNPGDMLETAAVCSLPPSPSQRHVQDWMQQSCLASYVQSPGKYEVEAAGFSLCCLIFSHLIG